jgi:iron complex outermembrane receptor protein
LEDGTILCFNAHIGEWQGVARRSWERGHRIHALIALIVEAPGTGNGKLMRGTSVAVAALSCFIAVAQSKAQSIEALKQLSIDQLLDVQVTSVSKRSEALLDAPASIVVITAEEIQRSGATTLPQALRLAPSLQVARMDSVQYAISARGFNNAVGNKLLVLVDGRTIYTPLFSGVFWDQQDLLLEDIDRIEVITGPGATLWGANAVNGVINVITRSAVDTTGRLLVGNVGSTERSGAVRLGTEIEGGAVRFYGKYSEFDNTERADGSEVPDEWKRAQIGFRADWERGRDSFTLQGDAYEGGSEHRGFVNGLEFPEIEVSGANVLARWQRALSGGSEIQVQAYVDHSERRDRLFFAPTATIADIEFQHSIPGEKHDLLWGGGYRHGRDEVDPGLATVFIPSERSLDWANLFVQDEIDLLEGLRATIGLKLERNDYTGTEYLPNVRLAWKPSHDRLVWGSLSRAVRAPARYDRDVRFPGFPPFLVIGGPNFESEVANVAELGYRARAGEAVSYSLTGFIHFWDKLRSGSAIPVEIENKIEGEVYGLEASLDYQPASWWILSAGLTLLEEDLQLEPDSTDPVGVDNSTLRNDPDYHWSLRSSFNLPHDVELDLRLWRVGSLPQPVVPSYTELDLRLAWHVNASVEVSLVGRNLLHDSHPEYGDPMPRSEIERNVFGQVRWRF